MAAAVAAGETAVVTAAEVTAIAVMGALVGRALPPAESAGRFADRWSSGSRVPPSHAAHPRVDHDERRDRCGNQHNPYRDSHSSCSPVSARSAYARCVT
jgi:hypothetical protein